MKKKIILIGSGGHMASTINLIESNNQFKIIGIIDKYKRKKKFMGYSIIGTDKDLISIFKRNIRNCCIGIGQLKDSKPRIDVFKKLKKIGFNIPKIISKSAVLHRTVKIGKGTTVFHNCIINSNAVIGENCIINTRAIIEHDTIIGNNCHISTGAIVNGSVKIGDNTFVGSGAIIRNNVIIGKNVVIGMGQKIKKNVKSNSTIK